MSDAAKERDANDPEIQRAFAAHIREGVHEPEGDTKSEPNASDEHIRLLERNGFTVSNGELVPVLVGKQPAKAPEDHETNADRLNFLAHRYACAVEIQTEAPTEEWEAEKPWLRRPLEKTVVFTFPNGTKFGATGADITDALTKAEAKLAKFVAFMEDN